MEEELIATFEAAKKAADAAEDDRCVDALQRLREIPVNVKLLAKTQILRKAKNLLEKTVKMQKLASANASRSASACRNAIQPLQQMGPLECKLVLASQDAAESLRKERKIRNNDVGRKLRALAKHPHGKIMSVAHDLLQFWKKAVLEEVKKDENKDKSGDSDRKIVKGNSAGVDTKMVKKTLKTELTRINRVSKLESANAGDLKAENGPNDGMPGESEGRKMKQVIDQSHSQEIVNAIDTSVIESAPTKQVSDSVSVHTPKLTSMTKCNDPNRDKLRGLLAEAFCKVSKETSESNREEVKNLLDEVNACDPNHVAVSVECALFEKLGPTTGAHKQKYRSIFFNLRDSKNKDLRRRVLLGHVLPEQLGGMPTEEMASDERKILNKQIREKALSKAERDGPPIATTDQFRCSKCGERKATYYQMQTRSADEPMTTFVTCVNCNNRWKFC